MSSSSVDSPKIWFTSDTHFWHNNIIQYCSRPYSSVEMMNELLIEAWNECVRPQDTIWHLGDFAFCGKNKAIEILEQLNGHKNLVVGNHDYSLVKKIDVFFDEVVDYKMLKVHLNYQADDGEIVQYYQPVVLCHFPLLSWDLMRHGSWHLHGHCHGTLPKTAALRLDVGVDVHGYHPINTEQIQNILALRHVTPEKMEESDNEFIVSRYN